MKEEDWLQGRASLGAAAGWKAEEIRIIADLGHALAQHGRNEEALEIFQGLAALAPATAYFQSALGALYLRVGELNQAVLHLNTALNLDPRDLPAYVNRGETLLRLTQFDAAVRDLRMAVAVAENAVADSDNQRYLARARALLAQLIKPASLPTGQN
jgi:predicted Zn-dependent protease